VSYTVEVKCERCGAIVSSARFDADDLADAEAAREHDLVHGSTEFALRNVPRTLAAIGDDLAKLREARRAFDQRQPGGPGPPSVCHSGICNGKRRATFYAGIGDSVAAGTLCCGHCQRVIS